MKSKAFIGCLVYATVFGLLTGITWSQSIRSNGNNSESVIFSEPSDKDHDNLTCDNGDRAFCNLNADGSRTNGPVKALKFPVLPLVFGSYQVKNKVVNLTPGEFSTSDAPIILDDYRGGFKVTKIKKYDIGLGVAGQAFVENATGVLAGSSGFVGLAVTKDKFVQFERFVSSKDEISAVKKLRIPFKAEELTDFKTGESVYYENLGGILFLSGVSAYGLSVGGSVSAEGGFRTLILKTSSEKVFVQVTKISVRKLTLFTGLIVLNLDKDFATELNNGFSYSFDLSIKEAQAAYERLLAGNMVPAQELSSLGAFTGVTKIENYSSQLGIKKRGFTIRMPVVFKHNWVSGKLYGQSETFYQEDQSLTNLNYGIYFKEHNGRFFRKQKKLLRAFYSAKAITEAKNGNLSTDQLANYYWSYENYATNTKTFNKIMNVFHKDLGLKASFNPSLPTKEKLGYMNLEARVEIPESYTKNLMDAVSSKVFSDVMSKKAISLISSYFAKGDVDNLCINEDDVRTAAKEKCKSNLTNETVNALAKIKGLLEQMSLAQGSADFTSLHALVGKEVVRNQFVLGTLFALDTNCQLSFNVKLEGQRISQIVKRVSANPSCR
jgi:hypothetical protein